MGRAMELLSGREVEGRPLYIREDRTDIEKEEGFVIFVRVTKRRKGSGGEEEGGMRKRTRGGVLCVRAALLSFV